MPAHGAPADGGIRGTRLTLSAAMGFSFSYAQAQVANMREVRFVCCQVSFIWKEGGISCGSKLTKMQTDDALNGAAGGCAAGFVAGLRGELLSSTPEAAAVSLQRRTEADIFSSPVHPSRVRCLCRYGHLDRHLQRRRQRESRCARTAVMLPNGVTDSHSLLLARTGSRLLAQSAKRGDGRSSSSPRLLRRRARSHRG